MQQACNLYNCRQHLPRLCHSKEPGGSQRIVLCLMHIKHTRLFGVQGASVRHTEATSRLVCSRPWVPAARHSASPCARSGTANIGSGRLPLLGKSPVSESSASRSRIGSSASVAGAGASASARSPAPAAGAPPGRLPSAPGRRPAVMLRRVVTKRHYRRPGPARRAGRAWAHGGGPRQRGQVVGEQLVHVQRVEQHRIQVLGRVGVAGHPAPAPSPVTTEMPGEWRPAPGPRAAAPTVAPAAPGPPAGCKRRWGPPVRPGRGAWSQEAGGRLRARQRRARARQRRPAETRYLREHQAASLYESGSPTD